MAEDGDLKKSEEAARAVVEGGERLSAVAARYGICPETLRTYIKNYKEGKPLPASGRRGRKPLLEPSDLDVLRRIVQANPHASVVEIGGLFAGETGKSASRSTLSQGLRAIGYDKKQSAAAAEERAGAEDRETRYTVEHRREPAPGGVYPSSLTDLEWKTLEPHLAQAPGRRGRPAKHSRREMADAMFYVVRTGCQWRMLPEGFPSWHSVWSAFRRWRDSGLLRTLYDALFALWRQAEGRSAAPSAGIVDSQSVKPTEKGGSADMMPTRN